MEVRASLHQLYIFCSVSGNIFYARGGNTKFLFLTYFEFKRFSMQLTKLCIIMAKQIMQFFRNVIFDLFKFYYMNNSNLYLK